MKTASVPLKTINAAALDAELRAAIGPAYDGHSYNRPVSPDTYTLHFADGTPQAVIDAALIVYSAHDPAVLTDDQVKIADQKQALDDLRAVDFTALQKAGTLQEVRDAVFKMAVAFGLTDAAGKRG